MNVDLRKLYNSRERKKITATLKVSKDLDWFKDLINQTLVAELLYLSEPLAECFKSNKVYLDTSLTQLIVDSLARNCQTVLSNVGSSPKEHGCSPEEIKFLGVSCHGIHLFLKSRLSCETDIEFLKELSSQLTTFLSTGSFIPRDTLILIIPLIIFINITYKDSCPKEEDRLGRVLFKGPDPGVLYYQANWQACLLKQCTFPDSNVVVSLLEGSLTAVSKNNIWYHFIHLDIILMCLRKHQKFCLGQETVLSNIFHLVTLFSDDRGLNFTKVCEEIQIICIKLQPELLKSVKKLTRGPWYSRNRMIYLNMYLSQCNLLENSEVRFILSDLVSHLGYNRLDHCTMKAVKTLLNKHMTKDNFLELLNICISCVGDNPAISRTISLYVAPLFRKRELFPGTIKEDIATMISTVSDNGKIVLFEMFYTCFRDELRALLINSQLHNSSSSDLQSTLITLLSKNLHHFSHQPDYLLQTYQNILTIPCPTVRVHAIASFQCVGYLAQYDTPMFSDLVNLFLENIYLEAPFHCVVTALNFFITLNIYLDVLTVLQREQLKRQVSYLSNHTDTDVKILARKIQQNLSCKNDLNGHRSCINSKTLLDDFLEEAKKITGLQNISRSDVPTKASALKSELHNIPKISLLETTKTSISLIKSLLNMISHSSCETYSAPSFEETFVIIESSIGGDEAFCKDTGKSVWSAIAGLLDLLGSMGRVLVECAMELYLGGSDMGEYVSDLYSIGDVCLKCIFRCRHRSVINASCEVLKIVSVSTAPHPPTHYLATRWMGSLLHVLCSPSLSSLSRRSAGLPEAIEAVLQCGQVYVTQGTVRKLIDTAHIPYHPDSCVETRDLVQVHSLHMLRLILSSAKLRMYLTPFTSQISELCYIGFIHPLWVVRNASFLLFAELVNYILGHKNTEFSCGYRSCLSIGELKQHYQGIYQQVISNLQTHSAGSQTCPSIFLSLMISSKLYPGPTSEEDVLYPGPTSEEDVLGGYLYRLLSSPIYKIRSVSARTIVLVCPRTVLERFIRASVGECSSSHNRVHGVLMFLLECCKVGDGLITMDILERILGNVKLGKLLDTNLSIVLEMLVTLRRDGRCSGGMRRMVVELVEERVRVRGYPSSVLVGERVRVRGYPSSVLDYLGAWFAADSNVRAVMEHIQGYYLQLSEVFWNALDTTFYELLEESDLVLLLELLSQSSSSYVRGYLANCIFEVLNCNKIPDLQIPPNIIDFLTDSITKYPHICSILSVSYNIPTKTAALVAILEENQRFDVYNTHHLTYLYKITKCNYNTTLTAKLLASALLHCQSEDEELRRDAVRFCVLHSSGLPTSHVTPSGLPTSHVTPSGLPTSHVTPRFAMECAMEFVISLDDFREKEVFVKSINEIRNKVLLSDCRGFDIVSNAHFDRNLFLKLTNIF